MPVPRGTRFRSKRISPTKYVRIAYKNNKIVESKIMRYKRKSRTKRRKR